MTFFYEQENYELAIDKNIKPHYNCFVLQNIQMYIRHVQVFHFHFRNEPI